MLTEGDLIKFKLWDATNSAYGIVIKTNENAITFYEIKYLIFSLKKKKIINIFIDDILNIENILHF